MRTGMLSFDDRLQNNFQLEKLKTELPDPKQK